MTIVVGTVRYEPAGRDPRVAIEQLVRELKGAGLQAGAFGRHLAKQILDPQPHPYTDYLDLVDRLTEMRVNGASRSQAGDDLEASAAQHLGAWTGRTGGIPGWAQADARTSPGGQDPVLYAFGAVAAMKNGTVNTAPASVDLWSDDVVGIVGGRAKDDNREKYVAACRTLAMVAQSHSKRPVVFAAHGSAPASVQVAIDAVGPANTFVQDAPGGPWRTYA
ncbi:hypothetical protein [Streptomyces sp. 058-1L]|uniref:hypothetical protein n=1 Tax=Streptomyces sp. 058-1L TaxID=2789266 RepID=UPI00398040F0